MSSNVTVTNDKHGGISTGPVPSCPLCGDTGNQVYTNTSDSLFGVPGLWDFRKCTNLSCGLLWLDPRPLSEEIPRLYARYYTHDDIPALSHPRLRRILQLMYDCYFAGRYGYTHLASRWRRPIGRLLYLLPARRARLDFDVMCLSSQPGGNLLEIGCGSGAFLARMQRLGWSVCGIDLDPKAVACARKIGLDVRCGTLEQMQFPVDAFDVITMSHVIEHVYDPAALLKECLRILRPGGKLVLTTPNADSWGCTIFGGHWRGLEPPRHFMIFSLQSLQECSRRSGFNTLTLRSISRWGKNMFVQSRVIRNGGSGSKMKSFYARTLGHGFQLCESAAEKFSVWAGEEIYFVGQKSYGRTGNGGSDKTSYDQAHSVLPTSVSPHSRE